MNKTYIEKAFGFDVEVLHPQFKTVFGEEVLDVNYKTLAVLVLHQIVIKPGRLSGNEMKYVIDKMEVTVRAFASKLGIKHTAIVNWKNKKNELTKMLWTTEKDIRLTIFEKFPFRFSPL